MDSPGFFLQIKALNRISLSIIRNQIHKNALQLNSHDEFHSSDDTKHTKAATAIKNYKFSDKSSDTLYKNAQSLNRKHTGSKKNCYETQQNEKL